MKIIIGLLITAYVAMSAYFINKQYYKNDLGNAIDLVMSSYVGKISEQELIDGAISGILAKLDKYSAFFSADEFSKINTTMGGKYNGIGIALLEENNLIIVSDVMHGSPAHRVGIQTGDVLYRINGRPPSRYSLNNSQTSFDIIEITIFRDNILKNFSLTKESVEISSISYSIPSDNIGMIRIHFFSEQTAQQLEEAWHKLYSCRIQGLILDLRDNSGGLLNQVLQVSQAFLPDTDIVELKQKKQSNMHKSYGTVLNKIIPIVILVNHNSTSGAEILAGSFQHHKRAQLVGQRTKGKGSAQSIFTLKNGSAIKITTAEFYLPSGEGIDGKGITPDFEVAIDQQIAKAIEVLEKQIQTNKINYDEYTG